MNGHEHCADEIARVEADAEAAAKLNAETIAAQQQALRLAERMAVRYENRLESVLAEIESAKPWLLRHADVDEDRGNDAARLLSCLTHPNNPEGYRP